MGRAAMETRAQPPRPASEQGRRDAALVRDALAGDPAAIDQFIKRMNCIPRMIGAGNRQLQRPLARQELEDLVQDTLAAVWNRLPEYTGRASLETWVYRFCFLELRYRLRKGRRVPALIHDWDEDVGAEPTAPVETSPLDYEHVTLGLEQLDEGSAEVVHLKLYEDLTFDEIGLRLSISANTAKSRYYRGLRKLRDILGSRTGRRKTEAGS